MSDIARTQIVRSVVDDPAPIDPVRVKDNPELTRFAQRVSDVLNAALTGPAAERVVRMRDLFDLGVVEIRGADGNFVRGSGAPPRDLRWSGGTAGTGSDTGSLVGPPGPPGPPGPGPEEPPTPPPPTVPVNLQASAALTTITLTWNA
jgi:hypothetical protein